MTYLDGTEEPRIRPTHCPLCRGMLVTKWSAAVQHRVRRGYYAMAIPAHVCEDCGVTIRVCMLPLRKLYATRKAARASIAKDLEERNKRRVR